MCHRLFLHWRREKDERESKKSVGDSPRPELQGRTHEDKYAHGSPVATTRRMANGQVEIDVVSSLNEGMIENNLHAPVVKPFPYRPPPQVNKEDIKSNQR